VTEPSPSGRATHSPAAGLWEHQELAVRAAAEELSGRGARALVVAACGTGKTVIGQEVSRLVAASGRVLVVVPTLELLAQTAHSYAARLGAGAGRIVAVCSESRATIEAEEVRAEMEQLHAGVSTDPAQIAAWLDGPGRVTVFTTYASLPVIAAAHRDHAAEAWDLLVVDEAHRSAGRVDRAWHVVHQDAAIPAARRLFMTATPRSMAATAIEATSMDDARVFGPEVFRLSFGQAIDSGLLADYRVVVAVVTDREVARLVADRQQPALAVEHGLAVTPEMLATQIALLKAAARYGLRRVITYHHRVRLAHRFAATLPAADRLLPEPERPPLVRAEAVDGTMPMQQRRDVLRHLRAPGRRTVVVSNARVLSEGVDVPELDGVMFADPRDSATDVVQAIGRALRRGRDGTKVATIVVPVLLEDGQAPEAALDDDRFATVWRVVRALRAHDERLADWLDAHRVQLTRGPEHAFASEHLLPQWMEVIGIPVTDRFARALTVTTVTMGTSSWTASYGHAAAHHAAHATINVPADLVTDQGFTLGAWINNQRSRRRSGSLNADQIARLDALGLQWDPLEAAWSEGCDHAAAYRAEHGHLDPTLTHTTPGGFALGQWLSSQRALHRRGALPEHRRRRLEQLGITWEVHDRKWQNALAAARAFAEEHGHADIPQNHTTGTGFRLGLWLSNQRTNYKNGTLAAERIAALEDLGVDWDMSDRSWTSGLAALTAFHAEHGHLNVPAEALLPGGKSVRAWIQARRQERREGALPADRIAALDRLGMVWEPYQAGWEQGLAALAAFYAEHGPGATLPRDHQVNGINLERWAVNRRKDRAAGRLPADRIAALDQVGMVWDPHAQDLRNGLAEARDFHTAHGHLRVPRDYTGHRTKALAAWLNRRRKEHREGTIDPDLKTALDDLGFIWDPKAVRAERALAALRDFHAAHGHLRVPATYTVDGVKVGSWLNNRRRYRADGTIDPDHAAALNAITPHW
jgi:superfamily II DNA or RNA helicase